MLKHGLHFEVSVLCKWGITVEMPVQVWVNSPDYPMELQLKNRMVDACLAPLVYKLNQNQIITLNCCCGHMQDRRFNVRYEDKPVHAIGSIIIDANSIRHSDSMGYYVTISQSNFAEIKLEENSVLESV